MKIRILLALGLTLVLAPPALAATGTVYDAGAKKLTLTNDDDGESFNVTLSFDNTAPETGWEYRVTATNAAIPLGGSTCSSADAGKTIFCAADDNVSSLYIVGSGGNDSFTINGTNYYSGTPLLDIRGNEGNDTFTAGAGAALRGDRVSGDNGDDTFNGSADQSDYFVAEAGNDTYRGGTAAVPAGLDPEGFQLTFGGDQWSPVGDTPVSVSIDGQPNDADGQGGTDNITEVERIEGTVGNDTLTAGANSVSFAGRDGDDTITGSPEGDVLEGQRGSDALRGGGGDDFLYDGDRDSGARLASDPATVPGNDSLDGGDGDDVLEWGAGKDDLVGGGGSDTAKTGRLITQTFETDVPNDYVAQGQPMTISLNDQADDGPTGGTEGDNVHADVEDVTIEDATGFLFAIRATRLAVLRTSPAADSVTGSAAANVIATGGGNDTVDPGAGADTVKAGPGDDSVSAVDRGTDTIQCGKGSDTVGADLPGANPGRADTLTDCETVSGTPLGLEGGALPVAPKVTVGGATRYKVKKFLRNYTVAADVTTDQAATVAGELTIAGAKIAKVGALGVGSGKLRSGTGKRKLKVKVAVKYRKAIKRKLRTKKQRKKGIKFALVVTVKNGSGQTTTSTRTIRVKG